MGGTWLLHCDRMPHPWIMECLFTSWGLHLYALIKFSFYSIKFLYFCMLISKYINILWFLNSCYKWLAIFNYFLIIKILLWGFPGGSDGEESVSNAGNLGLIPGSGRSLGEGNGYPLQCSCLETSMDREAWLQSMGSQRVRQDWMTNTFTLSRYYYSVGFWIINPELSSCYYPASG